VVAGINLLSDPNFLRIRYIEYSSQEGVIFAHGTITRMEVEASHVNVKTRWGFKKQILAVADDYLVFIPSEV
jgi:hypothetical protein